MLDKRAGFSSTSSFTTESIEFAINEAIKLAKAIDQKDERFQSFPTPKTPEIPTPKTPEVQAPKRSDEYQKSEEAKFKQLP